MVILGKGGACSATDCLTVHGHVGGPWLGPEHGPNAQINHYTYDARLINYDHVRMFESSREDRCF
eukprot:5049080-Pleurochrysis_carterae.AAC.1